MKTGTSNRALRVSVVTGLVGLAVTASAPSQAFERENIVCQLEELTRKISLRADPEAGYVCDVLYEKPDEGNTREVLWSARNNVEYCRPRFEDFVKQLASRGWVCNYSGESDDEDDPALAAAETDRRADDETDASEPVQQFRDWCIADVGSGPAASGSGSVSGYCNCVAEGMAGYDLSEADAQSIMDGLATESSSNGEEAADSSATSGQTDKRLNTLAVNYEYVAESCS